MAILACVALLSASLSAVADCASLCANTPVAPLHLKSAAMHCGHCASPKPLTHERNNQERGKHNPYGPNCSQHCLSQAIPGKVSAATAKIRPHATRELLIINNCSTFERTASEFAPLASESHSPPAQSGRGICRHTSLLRI